MYYEPTPEDWEEYRQWCATFQDTPPDDEPEPEDRPAPAPGPDEEPPW